MLALGLLLLASLNIASGVQLGGECWSTANGVAKGGCDAGTQCEPWNPQADGTSGKWDGSSPWYCVAYPKLKDGATCNYDNQIGMCDTGLSCISGKCSDPASAPTPAPTTAPTPAPTPAPAPCALEGGPKVTCMDTYYPDLYKDKCCKDTYTCDLIPGSKRTSFCNGKDLPENSVCWSDAQSSGTCADGLICKTPADATSGTCTKLPEDPACQATGTGVKANMVCYNSESKTYIKGGKCCKDFNTGSAYVGCMRDGGNPTGDRFCMMTKIKEGDACGNKEADNFLGVCDRSDSTKLLECIDGKCAVPPATSPPGPTEAPPTAPPCVGEGAKCYDNTDPGAIVSCCNAAECPYVDYYTDTYCPDAAGPATCADGESLPGTKCWDGATAAAVASPDFLGKCCYEGADPTKACPVTAASTDEEKAKDAACP